MKRKSQQKRLTGRLWKLISQLPALGLQAARYSYTGFTFPGWEGGEGQIEFCRTPNHQECLLLVVYSTQLFTQKSWYVSLWEGHRLLLEKTCRSQREARITAYQACLRLGIQPHPNGALYGIPKTIERSGFRANGDTRAVSSA